MKDDLEVKVFGHLYVTQEWMGDSSSFAEQHIAKMLNEEIDIDSLLRGGPAECDSEIPLDLKTIPL